MPKKEISIDDLVGSKDTKKQKGGLMKIKVEELGLPQTVVVMTTTNERDNHVS